VVYVSSVGDVCLRGTRQESDYISIICSLEYEGGGVMGIFC